MAVPETGSEDAFPAVVERLRRQVIAIVSDETGAPCGTGVVLGPDGLVITAYHVVAQMDARAIHVGLPDTPATLLQSPGDLAVAELCGIDPASDLAVLRVPEVARRLHDAPTPAARVDIAATDARRPREGEPVAVSGFVDLHTFLLTKRGIIASAWANAGFGNLSSIGAPGDRYLLDMTINLGQSGAPCYRSRDGVVVGVCHAIRFEQTRLSPKAQGFHAIAKAGLSVVIPIRYALELVHELQA